MLIFDGKHYKVEVCAGKEKRIAFEGLAKLCLAAALHMLGFRDSLHTILRSSLV